MIDLRTACRRLRGAAIALPLAGCGGVLDPAGPVAGQERQLLLNSLAIMLCIVVPTILATLAFAWWFRAGNKRATYRPHWTYSGQIELVVWGVPLLTIMLLGGVTWIGSHALDPSVPIPSERKPLEVQVVSLDWKWLFIYPEQHVASINTLTLPVGTPVHFTLTSSGVNNAFWIPQLGSQIMAMAAMVSQVWYQADRAGDFIGRSAAFSGDGFPTMYFTAHAVDPAQFEAWVGQTRGSGEVLDEATYRTLTRQSSGVAPATYRDIDPMLFNKVSSQQIPPSPGPRGPDTRGRQRRPRVSESRITRRRRPTRRAGPTAEITGSEH